MKTLIKEILEEGVKKSQDQAPRKSTGPSPIDQEAEDKRLEELVGEIRARIKVVGCGGAGSNTIGRLAAENLDGIEVYALNTDAQHLLACRAPNRMLIGRNLTRGLGAGSLPQVGEDAASENEQQIKSIVEGADLVFVTCGLGGGTGTGSAPVVAKVARDAGALVIGITTMPFRCEGGVRRSNAEAGLSRLRETADATIVIPNDKLLEIAPRLPLNQAFKVADEVLIRSILGLTEMITKPGLVNLDFADLRTIMRHSGVAMIGLGEGEGEHRARDAVEEALHSPLLDVDVSGAKGALVDVMGGPDMTLSEAEEIVETVHERLDPDARLIWGASVHPELEHNIRCMVVVTGVKSRTETVTPAQARPGRQAGTVRRRGEFDLVL